MATRTDTPHTTEHWLEWLADHDGHLTEAIDRLMDEYPAEVTEGIVYWAVRTYQRLDARSLQAAWHLAHPAEWEGAVSRSFWEGVQTVTDPVAAAVPAPGGDLPF